jgi:hypothetical protein
MRERLFWDFVGIRLTAGMQIGFSFLESTSGWDHHLGFELVLFALRYRSFYLDSLRAGFGTLGPIWGTALGFSAILGKERRQEVRIGVHMTFFFGYLPFLSGLQLTYIARVSRFFAFEVGLMQYSYPTAVALTFGFRI